MSALSTASTASTASAVKTLRLEEPRAAALLGEAPLVTLLDHNDPGTCLSVRLRRSGASWFGVLDDKASLLDRIRMGLTPGFVLHHEACTPTICGSLDVRILGRADAASGPAASAVESLLDEQPFGLGCGVLVEFTPRGLALEPSLEEEPVGAIPRT